MTNRKYTRRPNSRESLIVEHMAMVTPIAKTVRHLFASHIPLEDLVQSGYIGLIEAANNPRYNPAQGSFARFAYLRIRGAIIDAHKRQAYYEELHYSLDEHTGSRQKWP